MLYCLCDDPQYGAIFDTLMYVAECSVLDSVSDSIGRDPDESVSDSASRGAVVVASVATSSGAGSDQ